MAIHTLHSPAVSTIPQRLLLLENSFLRGGQRIVRLTSSKKTSPRVRKIECVDFKARSSGTSRIVSKALAQDVAAPANSSTKDKNVVFVAGATGRVGSRTVRELLKLGFKVRAGVRSVQRAESLVQSVKNLKVEGVEGNTQPIDKLELVECDLEKPSQIRPALGNSSIVICCIGASEKEVFDVTGPYRIDYLATKNLIDAATSAKVNHFILLTSLGTNKFGFPAAILNLFWGVLCWKRRAEEALFASGLPYTIVRPGGMERPTDSYKDTHNVTLSEEDTLFGGQVSNLQVAELIAFMAKNQNLSYCKVVEVIAETTAPLSPFEELLKKIPSKREVPLQESDGADKSEPIATDTVSITEKEPEPVKTTVSTPLSPYVAYPDLKPPSSPTPTPSTGSVAPKDATIDASSTTTSSVEVNATETSIISTDNTALESPPVKPYFLSPYPNYPNLKPPSSPSPASSTGSSAPKASRESTTVAATSTTSSSIEVNSTETSSISIESEEPKPVPKKTYFLSPYPNFENLKPPSSPTPTPSGLKQESSILPTSSSVASEIATGNDVPKIEISSGDAKDSVEALSSDNNSPYAAYDDLKPPSSPSPTAPVISQNSIPENQNNHQTTSKTTPLSPYTVYENLKPPSSPTPSPNKL